MKFRDFLLKTLLADTDYLVGYDEDGRYIRISRSDLATSLAASVAAPTLLVQYSATGDSWHDAYTAGDHYVRIKVGSGAWSAPIAICVSAYDIWLAAGNSGTEADFLDSLQGEPGDPADISEARLQDLSDYNAFLQQVNDTINNATETIVGYASAAAQEAAEAALAGKLDADLSNIEEIAHAGDKSSVLVFADGTLKRLNLADMAAYISTKQEAAKTTADAALVSKRQYISVTYTAGSPSVTAASAFKLNTTALYINGVLQLEGTDYTCTDATTMQLLTYVPVAGDIIQFMAIPA